MKKDLAFLDALAQALLLEVPESSELDRGLDAFVKLSEALSVDRTLREALIVSALPIVTQLHLVEAACTSHLSHPFANVLKLLVREGQLANLSSFVDRLKRMRERLGQVREVMVESTVELSATEKKRLKETLEKRWNMPIVLQEKREPSIIGGLRLRSGDWELDTSVQGRLTRFAHALV